MNFVLICFLWWRWHNGHNIGYDKRFSVFCLFSFITGWCCMGQCIFIMFMSGNWLAYCFGKMAPVTAIMYEISLWFNAIDNALLHASVHYSEDKTEEQITFVLSHACLYLSESDDEQDNKSAAANTFNISCGGGWSSYLLSAITVSVSDTSDVVSCWIFISARFLTNDPISSDYMLDWDNYSMLGIGGGDTNIGEVSFVLHKS